MPADDDHAVMERLAALEAEVKADADAQRVRKQAALEKVKEQRAAQQAASDSLRLRQAELVSKRKRAVDEEADHDSARGDGIGDALALARRAQGVHQELAKPAQAGDKSWVKSGLASMMFGPVGWLYAGSLREAVPGAAAWVGLLLLMSKLPLILMLPVLIVAMPASGIAGVLYAMNYNKTGKRQRLFGKGKHKAAKQLRGSRADE